MSVMPEIYGITTAITVAFAVGVLLAKKPLLAGYLLTLTMVGLGALFWELKSPLLGGLQILVYGGGVLIMVLFVVMLTPSGQSSVDWSSSWRAAWILSPVAGYLASRSYPLHAPVISGQLLGRWLLMRQGLSLEVLAVLLLLALVAALAIAITQKGGEAS
ncbi:MAG: NADH-ubiquinone oxidoreductase subunit 6 [Sulfobacillus benefaciens]|uniref:NADH-quinone oxidoreductase subunit J n=1 Tax=Sulfobacillus benefaciens TaxID=453960 RepID=A0A2T2X0X8_9FIRM|nr:MAG: NADH-ubiquinone oxidoreductase subunit 6 [Sulfobacillus benefaciens]